MTYFNESVNTSYGTRVDIKPNCSWCCDNDCVELVDSMLTNYGSQWDTVPVWYCARCRKVFSDRSSQMKTIYNSHYDKLIADSNSISNSEYEKENRINRIENKVNDIDTKVDNICVEFQKQKEDVLHTLKDRINNFKLS